MVALLKVYLVLKQFNGNENFVDLFTSFYITLDIQLSGNDVKFLLLGLSRFFGRDQFKKKELTTFE